MARIELGSSGYTLRALLDNEEAIALPIFQRPGTNALQMAAEVRKTMEGLKKDFPQGVEYHIVYDTTVFVQEIHRRGQPHPDRGHHPGGASWWCCSCRAGAPRSSR